jgi:tetratricopeptide (TPR) repeat protein
MSDQFENTQPNQPYKEDDTQPLKAVKNAPSRWKSILIGVLGFLLLIGLGGFGGYSTGIGARKSAEKNILAGQLSEQYSYALVDIEFGRYENARQRLEYIIEKDPSYPGAREKLTEVLVLSSVPTPEPTATIPPTPDFTGAENAFQRAQELIRAQDWPGALQALDSIRKLDATYKTANVDGMYYFALRNQGYDLITKQGNLEGGIYFLTLAERFGPLDNSAKGIREGARSYITGASFWELNWEQAIFYFSQTAAGWPSMWDGTMTASQRYFMALMRYGDELFIKEEYCASYENYQAAASIGTLEASSANNAQQAFLQCFPATPTAEPTATLDVIATEAPTDAPTEAPPIP